MHYRHRLRRMGLRAVVDDSGGNNTVIQRNIARLGLAVVGLAAGVSLLGTSDAGAAGCNGVVNQLEWGCAAWDNNNGPQFPHYKKPASAAPAAPAAHASPAAAVPKPVITQSGGAGIVAQGGGNIVAQGGGNVAQQNGNGIVAQGGGNAVQKNANGIVSQGGGNAIRK